MRTKTPDSTSKERDVDLLTKTNKNLKPRRSRSIYVVYIYLGGSGLGGEMVGGWMER